MNYFLKGFSKAGFSALAGAGLAATSLFAVETLISKPSASQTVEQRVAWETWYISGFVHCLVSIGEVPPAVSEEATRKMLRDKGYSTDFYEEIKSQTLPFIAKRIAQALGPNCRGTISSEDMKRRVQLGLNDVGAEVSRLNESNARRRQELSCKTLELERDKKISGLEYGPVYNSVVEIISSNYKALAAKQNCLLPPYIPSVIPY